MAKPEYNKMYYQKNKEKLLEMNRENQRAKYANEEERMRILDRNKQRYAERMEVFRLYKQAESESESILKK
jgi:hypothetical protein